MRLRLVLGALMLLLVASGAVLAVLLGSERGLAWALDQAVARSAGRLSIAAARGRLAGPLAVEGVRLRLGHSLTLEVAQARLDWRPALLLLGKLDITAVEARGVTARITPDPSAPPFVLPERLPIPVHISVASLAVDAAHLQLPGLPPVEVGTLRARAGVDARGLWLADLDARGPLGTLTGEGRMQAAQPYTVAGRFALDLTGAMPVGVHADLALDGRLEDLHLTAASRAPVLATLDARLQAPFSTRTFAATLSTRALALQRLVPDAAPVTLDGTLGIEGALRATTPLAVKGTLTARLPARPALQATLDGELAERGLRIATLGLRLDGQPGRATLAGHLALDTRHFDGALVWQDLGLARAEGTQSLSPQGRLTLRGDADRLAFDGVAAGPGAPTESLRLSGTLAPRARTIDLRAAWDDLVLPPGLPLALGPGTLSLTGALSAPRFALTTDLRPHDLPAAVLRATGSADAAALRLDAWRLEWLGGRHQGEATLTLGADPRLAVRGTLTDADPARLHPDWPGRVGLDFNLDAQVSGAARTATLRVHTLRGRLRERPLGGGLTLDWRPGLLAVPALDLTLGTSRLAGSLTPGAGARWELAITDLGDLLPGATGRLTSSGAARGSLRAPDLTLTLDADALAWRDWRASTLTGRTSEDTTGRRVTLHGSGLGTATQRVDSLDLTLAGGSAAHRATLVLTRGTQRLAAALDGGFDTGRWTGTLAEATLALGALGEWRLDAPARLSVTRDAFDLPRTCWRNAAASTCLSAAGDGAAWRLDADLARLALASLAPLLPDGLAYSGVFDGRVALRGGTAPLAGSAELTLSAGEVSQERDERRIGLLGYRSGRAHLSLADGALEGRLDLELDEDGLLQATLATRADGAVAARPVSGRLRVRAREFALVPVLLPEVRRFAGRLEADLAVAGTLGAPEFSGEARFSAGTAAIPRIGLEVEDLDLSITGSGDVLRFSGGARAGGTLAWSGALTRRDGAWRGDLALDGERFRALNLPEAQVVVSPELRLTLLGRDLRVTGTLEVPRARLAPRDLVGTVPVSDDQVIVRAAGAAPPIDAWRISTRVRTVLGEDVRFDGFGLRARVTGEIVATDTPDQLTLASGELAVAEGQYEAYGQQLTIERGRLVFTGGPITDPGMDVRATRLVERALDDEDVTVGVNIRGTLRRPQTALFAQSEATRVLSDSDMLSLLVLGHVLEDQTSTGEDQQALDEARQNLGLTTGGAYLARALGRQVGIEDVSIRNTGTEAQLVLGKYLSPRLYVSYGIGLFEPLNTVRVRYRLGSKWSLEAESGEENAADFKYTIEK